MQIFFKEYQTIIESQPLGVQNLLFDLRSISKEGFIFEIFANTDAGETISLGLKKTVSLR